MIKSYTPIYVILGIAILIAFINGISSILLPFVVGVVLSYFLVPIVNQLEQVKVPRGIASILTVILFISVIVLFSFTVLPVLYNQLIHLMSAATNHKAEIKHALSSIVKWASELDPEIAYKIESAVTNFSGTFFSVTSQFISGIISSSFAALTTIGLIFITPIVMFYALLNWHTVIRINEQLVPKRYKKDAMELAANINKTLTGYIKGQTYVCIILAFFYGVALSVAGLESAIALGVMSGVLLIIPYAGVLFSGLLCVLVAMTQVGSLSYALLILSIFAVGQLLEGNVLSPYLIGQSVGLNPIWIIFGVMAGGALFGFIGVLVALPLTAVLGVVIKFAFRKYTKSKFYNSTSR